MSLQVDYDERAISQAAGFRTTPTAIRPFELAKSSAPTIGVGSLARIQAANEMADVQMKPATASQGFSGWARGGQVLRHGQGR